MIASSLKELVFFIAKKKKMTDTIANKITVPYFLFISLTSFLILSTGYSPLNKNVVKWLFLSQTTCFDICIRMKNTTGQYITRRDKKTMRSDTRAIVGDAEIF